MNVSNIKISSALFAMALALVAGAMAAGCTHHHQPVRHDGHHSGVEHLVFGETARQIIYDYYRDAPRHSGHGSKKMPPGLAKRGGDLPPGLAKRSVLPPGLAGRDLPSNLISRLPAPHPDTVRVIIDDSIVLLHRTTHLVLDIIEHVVRH